jgi:hypothetical protein
LFGVPAADFVVVHAVSWNPSPWLDFPVTGKEQGISSENAREEKTCGDFQPLNQWLVEEFPARRNRELEPPEQGKNIAESGTRLAQSAIISTPCSAENE